MSGGEWREAGGGRSDWASRFRRANAAKQRAAAGQHHARRRVVETDRRAARELDPTAYLEAHGYAVEKEGRHLYVKSGGREVYRVTRRHDGRWLWCDRYGVTGGDNIDLVRKIEPGTSYAEAVCRLSDAQTHMARQPPRPCEPERRPQLPAQGPADRERGREYLKSRGISAETIKHAERTGMVRYADSAVLFVGYDTGGTARNVTRRAIDPADPVQKRDLKGSDKSYPPILPGDPAHVWIVEGGADALALHDIVRRKGQQPPTVIVSGGANVRSFLDREHVQAIIKRASLVIVAGENEKSQDAQIRADEGHLKQARRAAEITRGAVLQWKPEPEQGKDLADVNARQRSKQEHLPVGVLTDWQAKTD